MIIVVASRSDETARSLAARWDDPGATVLTSSDLSAPGWRYHPGAPGSGQAVAGGRLIDGRDITGVLTLLPGIYETELDHVFPEDRPYVASEMSAFLLAWLTALPCPVLNRPSPQCLCGPGWRPERWTRVAARLGIPVEPISHDSSADPAVVPMDSGVVMTVVGRRCFGEGDPQLASHTRQLASAAATKMLSAHFTGPDRDSKFVAVNLCPDLSHPGIAGAVQDYFRGAA